EKPEYVVEHGGVMINSDFLNGIPFEDAMKKTMDYFETKGWGKRVVTYHLRDWIFSRQRYWGEPIPMVNCEKCGWQPLSEDQLPLKLPYVDSYEPTETGESPLSVIPEFVNTTCPKCGGSAKRETDTMPNWAGSCWYFLRFPDPKNDKQPWSNEAMKQFSPVDWYLGGAEHAVLHLLYSRFWVKALYDLKLLDFKEPFLRLRNQGMILAEDHRKMSKSFGNVINPDDVISEFGADALRIYEMFMAPFNQEISWATKSLQGSYRFVKRIWDLFQQYNNETMKQSDNEDKQLVIKLQKTIKKVTTDIPEVKFNTSIASMMEFLNDYERNPQGLSKENAKKFLQILAPFAPFMTEEIWRNILGEKTSIHLSSWPTISGEIIEEEIILPVQVNGKLRATIKLLNHNLSETAVVNRLLKDEKVKKYIVGKPKKIIYIPGKIINFII
ncbi:MAG: class I tRNA ligase family protein, partial [Patescibacteria group bacterium]